MVTVSQLHEFINKLCEEEVYEPTEGFWTFRSSGMCSCCTDAARKVAQAFRCQVVGYFSSDNVGATIGGAHCEGHDFAFIRDRFIVD
jgi:hypothetical protein